MKNDGVEEGAHAEDSHDDHAVDILTAKKKHVCPECEGKSEQVSSCCGASIDSDILICSECREHSDIEVCETCNGTGEVDELFVIWNDTDGILASIYQYTDRPTAQKFVDEFPKRYEKQGYYRNNRMEKMDPKDVKLRIEPLIPE